MLLVCENPSAPAVGWQVMSDMEKLTLKPLSNEIVVNNGAAEGAVDVFCYSPDEASLRNLGALYVIGHRETDSSNMGYMVMTM